MKAKTVPPLWMLKIVLVIFLPLIAFGIVSHVVIQELQRAGRSIWIELRMEFGSMRDFWGNLR